ncbi:uncharacterized protein [Solanum tuberosum]|uniref:uncharacterized protein n=1 Tax=Solanum tuberosum TaxID=4113 RepID=UPI00073A4B9F|nr:PREDICTED: uncharacterized protein LOC107060552 [Solanum tuberosum]
MSSFVTGVSDAIEEECRAVMLHGNMDISRLMVHAQQVEESRLRKRNREVKRPRADEGNVSKDKFEGQVSSEGIEVDPKKTEAVKKWPRPLSPSDIIHFLGLAGYYRRFVEGFSSIASPLMALTQNKAKFEWSESCEKNFHLLKDKLISTPDYDMSALYHPKKANLVAYALSRVSMVSVAHIEDEKKELVREVHRLARLGVQLRDSSKGGFMVHHCSESSLVVEVKSKQHLDTTLMELTESVLDKSVEAFSQGRDGVLRYQGRLCVPDVDDLMGRILEEAHGFRYSIQPGATKMYRDLRDLLVEWNERG